MIGLGSGDYGEFTFLDVITLISFIIGLMNLEENLTQGDKQELQEDLSNKADFLLKEIHYHLKLQDKQLQEILEVLRHDNRRNLQPNS